MKKAYFALLLALALLSGLSADYIAAIPVPDILGSQARSGLNSELRELSESGYRILHYDGEFVVAAVPDTPSRTFASATPLTSYPAPRNIYLLGKLPGRDIPSGLPGRVLLDLGASLLLETDLDEIGLRDVTDLPFTLLGMEGIRFPQTSLTLETSQSTRTDIDQMVSLVSQTSVLSLLQSLQDFQTRYARADNRLQVAEWIRQQFVSFGVTDAVLQPFTWQNTTQYNVVATIPGSVYPEQYIIVGGHHDSISNNSDPYVLAPGADDNGSGSVAALEMARVMMQSGYQPRTSVRFVTFAAEEFGLWGAKHYAQTALDAGQNIRLMINHDMIANQTSPGTWQVRLMPYDGSLDHSAYASQITEQYTDLEAYYGSMNSGSSDSHPFWQRGYHVIYFFESDFSPVYHSSNDIIANLNPAYCTEVIKASVACAATFADMPAAPYDLEVLDHGNGTSLQAEWLGYNDPSIAYYNVYYSTTMGDWGTPLTTSNTTCMISGLTQGQLYYVAVSSVDVFGNESYMVYATGIPLSIPLQPQNFADQPQPDAILLTWDPNGELDLAGYKLYRSQQEGVPGDQIGGLITANSYLDSDVVGSQLYYYYSLCAVDHGNNASSFTQVVRSRPLTLDQGILIVDETEDMGGGNPFQPTDAEADAFYSAITQHFDTAQLDLTTLPENLRLADIGVYSTLVWHGNDFASMDYPYAVRDALLEYVQAGGNILFSVYLPTLAFELNASYPAVFGEDSYISSVLGIIGANYSTGARFKYALPVGGFPPMQVDPQKTLANLNGHIFRVEGFMVDDDCVSAYNYDSDYALTQPEGLLNGSSVGVLNLNHPGKILTLSVPLYNIYEDQARAMVDHLFTTHFGESFSDADDPQIPSPPAIGITGLGPNPFRERASFRVDFKNAAPVQAGIYNLRGQLVKTLFSGEGSKSLILDWDGRDDLGHSVSSGVYFLRVSQGDSTAQKRIARIK